MFLDFVALDLKEKLFLNGDMSSGHGDRKVLRTYLSRYLSPCYPRLKSGTREPNKGLLVGADIEAINITKVRRRT
jgi:hypothetical protein